MNRQEQINLALAKYQQIDKIHDEIHDILMPMVVEAMSNGVEAVEDLISKLPASYYRAELRGWLKERS